MTTIYHEFSKSVDKKPKFPAIQFLAGTKIQNWDYASLDKKVKACARGLRALGYQKGDRIAMVSTNHPHWAIVDLALSREGMILVPMHTTLSLAQFKSILERAEVSGLVIGQGFTDRSQELLTQLPAKVKHVVFFSGKEKASQEKRAASFHSVEELIGLGNTAEVQKKYKTPVEVVGSDSCVIIFTSGTTGEMKGVELTQENLVRNAYGADAYVRCPEGEVILSVLPLSHAFERVSGFLLPLFRGLTVAFGRGLETLVKDIQIIRPNRVDAVPRLLEKMFEGIQNNLYQKSPALQIVFNLSAKASAWHRDLTRKTWLLSPVLLGPHLVFNTLFFSKVRKQFGGRLKRFIVGGAPLDHRVAFFFDALGFEILEGYGLTECSPVVTVNEAGKAKIGSVGRAIPGVKVKIGDQEEICVQGHNVMKGYFKNPTETAKVIDEEGWFHTGDQGSLDREGYLYVKGRVKELIVTSYGKNIVPNQVEQAVEASPFISQSMVYGHGRSYLVALVVPARERVLAHAESQNWQEKNNWDRLCREESLKTLLHQEMQKHTQDLAHHEQVKKFYIIPQEFSQEEDLLTPTLKLKRKKIAERFQKELDSLY